MPKGRDNAKGKNPDTTCSEVNPSSESKHLASVAKAAKDATDKSRNPTQG